MAYLNTDKTTKTKKKKKKSMLGAADGQLVAVNGY